MQDVVNDPIKLLQAVINRQVADSINGAGGIENALFLKGGEPVGPKGPNAEAALFYATFWIEKVSPQNFPPFMQLQYAQMAVLNFEVLTLLPASPNVGWPHISVATLRKGFN